jgi:hypothetical protein
MQKRLNILVFAYVFPPDAGSGTYRTLYFANQWARHGDEVTIITVKQQDFLEAALIDNELCREVHPSIRIIRASAKRPLARLLAIKNYFSRKTAIIRKGDKPSNDAPTRGGPIRLGSIFHLIKDTITDLLSCPDEHIGWVPDAVRHANRIAKSAHTDCIYATGGPWSSLLAALLLHKRRDIPLVLDFRDPWVGNPNLTTKSPWSRWAQKKMESICVKASSIVVANTEELREDFIKRYPGISPDRFITVTNGFEDIPQQVNSSTDKFTLIHAGALYQSRNPLNFLQAVVEIVRNGKISAEVLRVQMVGGLSTPDPKSDSMLRSPILQKVLEIIPRVTHDKAIVLQQRANVLLLFQIGFPLQIPRKLYEYLSLSRPILAITESDSATAKMVKEIRSGYVVEDNVIAIKEAILKLYNDWTTGATLSRDEERVRRYSNQYLANRLRDIMLKL